MAKNQRTKKALESRRIAAEQRQREHDALGLQDKIDKATSRPGDSEKELVRYYTEAKALGWAELDRV